jgi:hypothetical protein
MSTPECGCAGRANPEKLKRPGFLLGVEKPGQVRRADWSCPCG